MIKTQTVTGLFYPRPGDVTIAGPVGSQHIEILSGQRSDDYPAIMRCRQPRVRGHELYLTVGPEGITPASTFTVLFFDGANGFKPSGLTGVRGIQYWPDAKGFIIELALSRPREMVLALTESGQIVSSPEFKSDSDGVWTKDGTLIVQGDVLKPMPEAKMSPGNSGEIIQSHGFEIYQNKFLAVLLQRHDGKYFPLYDPAMSIEVISFDDSEGTATSMAILNDGSRKRVVFRSAKVPHVEAKGWFETIAFDPTLGPVATFAGKEFLIDSKDGSVRYKEQPHYTPAADGFDNLDLRGDPLLVAIEEAKRNLDAQRDTGLAQIDQARIFIDDARGKGVTRVVMAAGLGIASIVSGVSAAVFRYGFKDLVFSNGLLGLCGLTLAGTLVAGFGAARSLAYARSLSAEFKRKIRPMGGIPQIDPETESK